jgi:hypothetical protein
MRIFWGLIYLFSGVMFGLTACHVLPASGWDLEVACGFTPVVMVCDGLGKLIGVDA